MYMFVVCTIRPASSSTATTDVQTSERLEAPCARVIKYGKPTPFRKAYEKTLRSLPRIVTDPLAPLPLSVSIGFENRSRSRRFFDFRSSATRPHLRRQRPGRARPSRSRRHLTYAFVFVPQRPCAFFCTFYNKKRFSAASVGGWCVRRKTNDFGLRIVFWSNPLREKEREREFYIDIVYWSGVDV